MTLFFLTGTRQYGYAFNVAQNHIEQAVAAPVRHCGLFMPVFNGGGARNSLRVITPRFLFSVLSPRRLSGLKSSLVGVLKRFEQGAFKMTLKSADAYGAAYAAYVAACKKFNKPVKKFTPYVPDEDRSPSETEEILLAFAKQEGTDFVMYMMEQMMKGENK